MVPHNPIEYGYRNRIESGTVLNDMARPKSDPSGRPRSKVMFYVTEAEARAMRVYLQSLRDGPNTVPKTELSVPGTVYEIRPNQVPKTLNTVTVTRNDSSAAETVLVPPEPVVAVSGSKDAHTRDASKVSWCKGSCKNPLKCQDRKCTSSSSSRTSTSHRQPPTTAPASTGAPQGDQP